MLSRTLGFLVLAAGSLPAHAPAAPALEVAVEDAAALWSRGDGTGFANDVVRAAFHAAGIEVAFRVVPYARCKQMVRQGAVAACFSMSRDPDLKGSVLFPSVPIFTCYADLFLDPKHPLAGAHLRDLPRGTVVGTVLSYEYPDEVRKAVKSGAIVLDESPTEQMLLRKLAAGRLPAAIFNVNDAKSIAYLSALAHVPNTAVRVDRVGVLQSYLGFSVKHPRGAESLKKFEEGLRRIGGDGTLAEISRRWADTSRRVVAAATSETARPRP